jgi:hypothetical protein
VTDFEVQRDSEASRPSGRCWVDRFQEKPSGDKHTSRTKTDTGRRGEKPQALEIMVVKELGKLTPYVRNKGALLETEGAENRLWELFIKNTALC